MRLSKGAATLLALPSACIASLPIVDLGYELHQACSFDESLGLYNFSNIRYAAPPLGDRRFRVPVPPETNRSEVQTGSVGRICPQASTIWMKEIAPAFIKSVMGNTEFNKSTDISSYPYNPPEPDPRATEDCLFLDVVVPEKIFDRAQNKTSVPKSSLAPVLVWIYGGAYIGGEKSTDASGLVNRSMHGDAEGVVYVALNYRLGAFGWLAGHSVTANGTANAGLHDQRFGLDWVYKNIHLFGGDPERVTVMGVSAGGGSIMHQVTAYGGTRGPAPFQQAILQSPGWYPVPSEEQQEATLQEFLGVLNVNSVDEARQLPSDKLMAANSYQVARTELYSTFTYGPVVDGTFVPKMPGKLLREGDYDHNLNIMVGHNSNEGIVFTPPSSRNESNFGPDIRGYFPDITPNVVEYIVDVLYPPVYNGSQKYTTSVERMAQSIADVVFQCNTNYFNEAFDGDTYSYMFSIPPGFHGQDVSYTFYKGGNSSVLDPKVARAMQDYFTSFAQTGKPKSSVGPEFKRYGDESRLLNLGLLNITTIEDPTDNRRCLFWQQVPYYEE